MNEIIQRQSLGNPTVLGDDPLAELARIVSSSTPARPAARGYQPAPPEPVWTEANQHDQEPEEETWYEDEQPAYADEAGYEPDAELYDDRDLEADPAAVYADERPVAELQRRGNGGMLLAGLVVVVAVIGGGATLAYKSGLMGDVALPGSGSAPLIRASTDPVKVTPPPQAAGDDGSASAKEIFDRAGNAASTSATKMVSRDEQPVPLPDTKQAEKTPSRVATEVDTTAPPAVDTGDIDLTGPRKVKTIKILADGRTATDSSVQVRRAAVSAISMPQPAPDGDAPDSVASLASAGPAPDAASTDAAATPAVETPAAKPPVRPKVAKKANSAAPAATQVASIESPASLGSGFVVQIASQKSEGDATATFRRMQAKYSSVLGGLKPSIVKAELGDKGTFYRIRVGPMASRDGAVDVCMKLRAAGGSCVVARF